MILHNRTNATIPGWFPFKTAIFCPVPVQIQKLKWNLTTVCVRPINLYQKYNNSRNKFLFNSISITQLSVKRYYSQGLLKNSLLLDSSRYRLQTNTQFVVTSRCAKKRKYQLRKLQKWATFILPFDCFHCMPYETDKVSQK